MANSNVTLKISGSLKWERLRMALAEGLSAKESDYQVLSATEIKERARKRNNLPA